METELIMDGGITTLQGKVHDNVALTGKAALDAVFITLDRRPRQSLLLLFSDDDIYTSVDGERLNRVDDFTKKYISCVLGHIGLHRIRLKEGTLLIHVNVDS